MEVASEKDPDVTRNRVLVFALFLLTIAIASTLLGVKDAQRVTSGHHPVVPLSEQVAECVTSGGGCSPENPFPSPLSSVAGVTANIANFAVLPDSDGDPAQMMLLTDEPGSRRLFVSDKNGPLYSVSYDGRVVLPYLDLRSPRWNLNFYSPNASLGFHSFAFHPQFNTIGAPGHGKFYTYSNTKPGADQDGFQTVLLEWTARDPAAPYYDGDPPRELLRDFGPVEAMLAFNPLALREEPDYGLLYVGVSDPRGGSPRLDSLLGKMLRIDPLGGDGADKRYGIPADNPFADDGNPNTLGEIYAYGMRVPQRFAWDPTNGNLFVADIGAHSLEEISLVTPGANLGWPEWEGSFKKTSGAGITLDNPRGDASITYPVVEYDHTDELLHNAVAVTGIVVYRDDALPQLKDLLLFGDVVSGDVFFVQADTLPAGGGASSNASRHV